MVLILQLNYQQNGEVFAAVVTDGTVNRDYGADRESVNMQ